jgi:hypothetical protein
MTRVVALFYVRTRTVHDQFKKGLQQRAAEVFGGFFFAIDQYRPSTRSIHLRGSPYHTYKLESSLSS